uniref:Reverse transcriptase domain-containing protein n=1 Tax=Steinernema glaseri TaxID=37863 RepID=A0A1I7Z3L8_9BILA
KYKQSIIAEDLWRAYFKVVFWDGKRMEEHLKAMENLTSVQPMIFKNHGTPTSPILYLVAMFVLKPL